MTQDEGLDEKHLEILRLLQEDARISTVDLAEHIGLSPASTGERLKYLIAEEFVSEFAAHLNARRLGLGLLVFVQISLAKMTEKDFNKFAVAVKAAPEILECHMVSGGYDYLIKVRVRDMTAYTDFFYRVLLKLPNIRETHSYPVMEEVKPYAPLPLPDLRSLTKP